MAAPVRAQPAQVTAPPLQAVQGDAFITDLRYDTADNFLKQNVYARFKLDRCFVHRDLLLALNRAVPLLKEKGLKLVLWDCYRPPEIQKTMWALVPDSRYVANPKIGSRHNRAIAVDVTLARVDGARLAMPTAFDDFTPRAAPSYKCRDDESEKCRNRDLLIAIMTSAGLSQVPTEWWHFQLPLPARYPIVDRMNGAIK